jgi:hypothetical protein
MNRFDNGSVSAYTPQSFQELSFTPMMKRAQHDEMSKNIAELDAIATDPLNEHRDEALKLKQDFESKLGNISGELASKGIDGIGRENFYRLKKEHDDLVAPTGRIGQINAAKIDYNKQQEEFIKNAEKQNIGRDRALQLWKEKTNTYTGYDSPEKSKILNVTPQGVAAFQDYEKYKQVAKSLMGEVESESRNGGYNLVDSGLGNGTKVMVDSKGFKKNSSNLNALNNAILAGNEMWLKPTGEGYQYNQDAGVDQNNFRNRFIGDFGSMLKTSKGSGYEENGQFINDTSGPKNEEIPSSDMISEVDPNQTITVGKQVNDYDFSEIGKPKFNTTGKSTYSLSMNKPGIGNNVSYKEIINNPLEQKRYEILHDKLIKSGKINKSRGLNDPIAAKAIHQEMMKQGPITMDTKFIRPGVIPSDYMFMGDLDRKGASNRNAVLNADLQGGVRQIINPETKLPFTQKEWNEGKYTAIYDGYYSPMNFTGFNFGNKNEQQVMPHRVLLYKDKQPLGETPVGRTDREIKDPKFKASKAITYTYRNAALTPNEFTTFGTNESSSGNLKGIEVRYVTKDKNGQSLQEPMWQIKKGSQLSPLMEDSEFLNRIYKNY